MDWKKMSKIAKELGVSKDVIKYHKKSLPDEEWGWNDENQIVISPDGVNFIKSRLKKKSYDFNFEKYTREKLKIIERQISYLHEFLLNELIIKSKTNPISNDLQGFLGEGFVIWYMEQKNMETWDENCWNLVSLPEIQRYFDYKNGK